MRARRAGTIKSRFALLELAVAQVAGGQDGGDLMKIVVEGFD
jgi:hypothetical protein